MPSETFLFVIKIKHTKKILMNNQVKGRHLYMVHKVTRDGRKIDDSLGSILLLPVNVKSV